jgi:two-component system, NarL family, nitrate/nitrite response regulator NarL
VPPIDATLFGVSGERNPVVQVLVLKSGESVRVVVADDHPLYLDGIVAAVERAVDLDLVAACGDGRDALREILALRPHVAAIDHMLPGLDATQIVEALAAAGSPTRTLIFSARLDGRGVYDAIQAGAAGYVSKSWSRSRICDAIRSVAQGHSIFAEELHDSMGAEIRRRGAIAQELLTDREREILVRMAEGSSAPKIAGELYLSTATIKTHQHNLYEKLGVSDRAAAVAEAIRRGLIR